MIRWVNEIFEVQAMDSPVRACERRKNPVEGQCSGANLSDIGTSCLDLRKNHAFSGLSVDFVCCQSLPYREPSALSGASTATVWGVGETSGFVEPSSSSILSGALGM